MRCTDASDDLHALLCEAQWQLAGAIGEAARVAELAAGRGDAQFAALGRRLFHEMLQVQLKQRRVLAAWRPSGMPPAAPVQHDALTGLANRRALEQRMARLLEGRDAAGVLCAARLDVDGFAALNERHTAPVGDQVLQAVARVLRSQVRDSDLAARLNDDVFIVLFAGAPAHVAALACARIREALQHVDWRQIAPGLQVSLSIGVAQALPDDSVPTLLERCEAAMQATRRSGAPAGTGTVLPFPSTARRA